MTVFLSVYFIQGEVGKLLRFQVLLFIDQNSVRLLRLLRKLKKALQRELINFLATWRLLWALEFQ